jgi:hypothetical protein
MCHRSTSATHLLIATSVGISPQYSSKSRANFNQLGVHRGRDICGGSDKSGITFAGSVFTEVQPSKPRGHGMQVTGTAPLSPPGREHRTTEGGRHRSINSNRRVANRCSELRQAGKGLFARHPLIRTIMSLAGAGGSTLMKSTPNPASRREAKGAELKLPSSITFVPDSGLCPAVRLLP